MAGNKVAIEACFTDQVKDDCGMTPMFAMIALVAPTGYEGPVYCEQTGDYVSTELPIKVNLDSKGCLKSCPLIPNSSLNVKDKDGNPATYYEIVLIVADEKNPVLPNACQTVKGNGSVADKCRQKKCNACHPGPSKKAGKVAFSTKFVLDDRKEVLPACVKLSDVTIDGINHDPSALQCAMFQACETPWVGITEGCIEITPGDNPDGCPGNGHAPTFALKISDLEGQALTCTEDGLYVALKDWDCSELENCSISQLGDVDIEGCAIGQVLQWNGAGFVCGPKAQVEVIDGQCTTGLIVGTGSIQNPWAVQFNVEISDIADNQVICNEDGLYVAPAYLMALGVDTDCISVDVNGAGTEVDPIVISANPILSSLSDNKIECLLDGLYVGDQSTTAISCFSNDCTHPSNITDIDLVITGSGTPSDPLVFCPEIILCPTDDNLLQSTPQGLKISCQEIADQIGLSAGRGLVYTSANKSLSICLSSDDGNIATFGEDGCIYVPSPELIGGGIQIVGCDTDVIDTTVSGLGTVAEPFRVCSTLELDPEKNLLSITGDGLLASPPVFAPGDHCEEDSCISITVAGCGLPADPFLIDGTVIVSEEDDNAITCKEDGLYAPLADGSETILLAVGEDCINVELDGTGTLADPYELTVGLSIDPALENQAVCRSQGIFVPSADGSETQIQALNNTCVATNVFGNGTTSAPYVIESSVIISGTAGNTLGCTDSGLYVGAQVLNVSGSECIDLKVSGTGELTNPWALSADIKINTAETNLISCEDGLYVPAPKFTILADNCLDFQIDGSGTEVDPWVIDAGIIVDPNPCNIVKCGIDGLGVSEEDLFAAVAKGIISGEISYPVSDLADNCMVVAEDGLYVKCADGSETVVQHVSGNCTTASIVGSGTVSNPYVLSTNVQISGDANNNIVCTANGLYASPTMFDLISSPCIEACMVGLGTAASPYLISNTLVISEDDCNGAICTDTGLFVEDRGYLSLSSNLDFGKILTGELCGTGSICDPYELDLGISISDHECNTLEIKEDGLFVAASGHIVQSSANPNCDTGTSGCVVIDVDGDGSKENPYFIKADIRIDNQAVANLVRCTDDGLLVSPQDVVQTIINNYAGDGLGSDDGDLVIVVSEEANNCLKLNNDGLFVACPTSSDLINMDAADSALICTTVTGDGSDVDPFVVYSELKVDPDPCNIINTNENGLFAKTTIGFEIGQDGVLDATAEYPSLWRAWCDGTVEFKIAGLSYGSVSNAATHYEIINQSGDIVYSGFIPPGAQYDTLNLGPFNVSEGQGYAVRVVAPFPEADNCVPACGLVIQGVYCPCCE